MKPIAAVFLVPFLAAVVARAELRLPTIISDHAVLQADKAVAVWGWAEPGSQVKVEWLPPDVSPINNFTATADANGKWSGRLKALRAGTTGSLHISTDKGAQKMVNDVLVGEVWLGSGQSNMSYVILSGAYAPESGEVVAEVARNIEIAQKEADTARPPIRYFKVVSSGADQPTDDVKGQWVLGSAANVKTFSAVAWNFGVALQNQLHVPIGLIVSAVGGVPVESYMPRAALEATSVGKDVLDRSAKLLASVKLELIAKYQAETKAWDEANPTPELKAQHKSTRPRPINGPNSGAVPNRLYNGMLHGLVPYSLRGFIWFQADGNMGHPLEYAELFQALIKSWRVDWQEELPFYFVEMNNMRDDPQTAPVQSNPLSIIREQQHGGLQLPATGIVGSIDLGVKDPHFPNKKPVGERLAGLAMRDCYHRPGLVNSPMYRSFSVEGGKVRLKLSDAEGLRIRGGGNELKGFAIRADKGNWIWAAGRIDGEDVVVWNEQIPAPAAVRYAWAMNPVISVENGAGLPLLPFRTDTGSEQ